MECSCAIVCATIRLHSSAVPTALVNGFISALAILVRALLMVATVIGQLGLHAVRHVAMVL